MSVILELRKLASLSDLGESPNFLATSLPDPMGRVLSRGGRLFRGAAVTAECSSLIATRIQRK